MNKRGIINDPAETEKYSKLLIRTATELNSRVKDIERDLATVSKGFKDDVFDKMNNLMLEKAKNLLKLSQRMTDYGNWLDKKAEEVRYRNQKHTKDLSNLEKDFL